jgi:predicted metal-binding membrane protein
MAYTPAERPSSFLELALRSERLTTLTLVVALPLACWAWIVVMARDMYGPMTGASRWMMTPLWDAPHLVLLWAMWAVMMIAMMLPSAAPLILLFAAAVRRTDPAAAARHTYVLASGYVAVWAGFSIGATALQRAMGQQLVLSPMMEVTMPAASGAILLIAGVYQLTPLKQVCLRACQSPLGFLLARWRSGLWGAFRLGLRHGLYCVGCCWALMLLLFVGGVMNLSVIVALTLFVATEKAGIFGVGGSRVAGVLLVVAGLWTLRVVL